MKKYILILFSIISFWSCKETENESIDITVLPSATTTGANTFGCLMDGWVYVGGRYLNWGHSYVWTYDSFYYYTEEDKLSVNVSVKPGINLSFTILSPQEGKESTITDIEFGREELEDGTAFISRFDTEMKIIIVGIGKVGYAIAEQMTGENHDLVVIDRNNAVLDHVDSMLDVMCVEGNGASASVLLEAGVREADLLIAVSENDEVNLICCLMAKKLGAKHTVARVRNPEYFRDAQILRREIGLDMIINPENAAAQEISRILRVPSAFSVETFARGLVELIGFQTEEGDSLVGKSLIDYNRENPNSILMCAAKRGEEVIVPNGSFVPQTGDRVYVIGTPAETTRVLRSMGRAMAPIRRVSILGGSRIAQYLAWVLTDIGTHVTIVEKDEAKCLTLAEKLPKVTVIHGDGTNHDLLESEGIFHCDAFIAVTDRDEENLLMALTAKRYGVKKVVPKMSRMGYLDIVNLTGLDTVISPKAIIASQISSYVRGLANSQGSAVESLHYILGGAIEAVEFTATSATHFLDRPLSDLHFRNGLLVAAIVHNGRMEIPNGHSQIHAGDRVIVVAKKLFLQDLNDILG